MSDSSSGLSGNKLLLRSLSQADQAALRLFVNDPVVMQTSNIYWPIDDLRQEKWFHAMSQAQDAVWFGIEMQEEQPPRLVGTCCLVGIDWVSRLAELRIRIGYRDVWGQGIGTHAVQLLVQYGFLDLNLERIWLRVYASNLRAIHLYEKIGFHHEGRLRRAAYIHGAAQDVLVMGLLREEWSKVA